jgi:hypothetical protein
MTNKTKALLFILGCTSCSILLLWLAPGIILITVSTFGLCAVYDAFSARRVLWLMNAIVAGLVMNACIVFTVVTGLL